MLFAICIWGLLRSVSFTIDNIKSEIYNPLTKAGHGFHVHMHTFTLQNKDHKQNASLVTPDYMNEILQFQPKYISIESQDQFDHSINFTQYEKHGDPWRGKHNNFESLKNLIRSLYSLKKVTRSVYDTHVNYQAVIFIRPDVLFMSPIPVPLLEKMVRSKERRSMIHLPDFHRLCRQYQFNDRFAMMVPELASFYGERYDGAEAYSQKKKLHSESFLYYYLHSYNISVIEIPFRFKRVRSHGDIAHRDKTLIYPNQQSKDYHGEKKNNSDPHDIYCKPVATPYKISVLSDEYKELFT